MRYKTRLTNQHASSEKLGRCGVCSKYAQEVYILSVQEQIEDTEDYFLLSQTFGHLECLEPKKEKYELSTT